MKHTAAKSTTDLPGSLSGPLRTCWCPRRHLATLVPPCLPCPSPIRRTAQPERGRTNNCFGLATFASHLGWSVQSNNLSTDTPVSKRYFKKNPPIRSNPQTGPERKRLPDTLPGSLTAAGAATRPQPKPHPRERVKAK